jgi:hypothetical protein
MIGPSNSHPAPGMTPKAALAEPVRHGRKAVRKRQIINPYGFLIGFTLIYMAQVLIDAAMRVQP